MTQQIVQKDTTATLISAIFNLIESSSQRKPYKTCDTTGKIYVTVASLMHELKLNETPMTYGKTVQVLRNVASSQETRVFNFMEYHELDCKMLLTFASKLGKDAPNLRKIVESQEEI